MKKAEFERIVKESVAGGAKRAEAEAYAISGYKIPVDDKGKPVFETAAVGSGSRQSKPKAQSRKPKTK